MTSMLFTSNVILQVKWGIATIKFVNLKSLNFLKITQIYDKTSSNECMLIY